MITTIGTHNGKFHADEVVAVALLEIFVGDFRLIRSRDSNVLEKAQILIDVGGKYEPNIGIINYLPDENRMLLFIEGYYDHHHFDSNCIDYGYSSAGLIWKDLVKKQDYYNDHGQKIGEISISKKKYPSIDNLVKEVDQQDIGVTRHGEFHFCNLISKMNADNIYSEEQDDAFQRAVDFAMVTIKDLMRSDDKTGQQLEALEEVKLIEVNSYKVAISPLNSDWIPPYFLIDKADIYVSYDHGQFCWSVQMIPLIKDEFPTKYSLESTSSVGELFVHKSGFIGKYKSDNHGYIWFSIKGDREIMLKVTDD